MFCFLINLKLILRNQKSSAVSQGSSVTLYFFRNDIKHKDKFLLKTPYPYFYLYLWGGQRAIQQ